MGGALRNLPEALAGSFALWLMVKVAWQHGLGRLLGCVQGTVDRTPWHAEKSTPYKWNSQHGSTDA